MLIRKALIEDAESVVQILRESRLAYLPFAKPQHSLEGDRRWAREKLIPTGDVVILSLDGVDAGVLATSVSDEIGWIDQLYLAPGYVGQGYGSALLNHALGVLPKPIHLWTFQENDKAIRFYERHGFTAIKYTNGEDNEEQCPDVLFELR